QEVIDRCWSWGDDNPIVTLHDVGAGGLSNAIPELLHDSARGGRLNLRAIPSDEPGLSPLELWCNESQERYVLGIAPHALARFEALCRRERCPYAVVGRVTDDGHLQVRDDHFDNAPVDVPLELILGKPPRMERDVVTVAPPSQPWPTGAIDLNDALTRVLQLPTVADKTFLVTIGDRTVTGLVGRDQMVGPWQVPVADCGITLSDFEGYAGEAMALGERPPLALLSGAASARMALGEALTNLAAAPVEKLGDVRLSANWMASAGTPGEDQRLYEAVRALGAELAPALGIAIPVGKDSMSMRAVWSEHGASRSVDSPLSLMVTAFAPVYDVRKAVTPELSPEGGAELFLIEVHSGKRRLGGSAVAQVYGALGVEPPDVDDPHPLAVFFAAVQALLADGLIVAYHDRSDGGLIVTLLEMAFASWAHLELSVPPGENALAYLFAEELGAVVQVAPGKRAEFEAVLTQYGLKAASVARCSVGGSAEARLRVAVEDEVMIDRPLSELRRLWSDTTYAMQAERDDRECADEEHNLRTEPELARLDPHLTFDPGDNVAAPWIGAGARPRIAILREQGVNGHVEMAAAFSRAGFEAVDVHMSDLQAGRRALDDFVGLAACGGFSYGDVLGAGRGWAQAILLNQGVRRGFERFFVRDDTFALGVCNGCQMLAHLAPLIPGAEGWPTFVLNRSMRFEARLSTVRIESSPSILFRDMVGTRLPVAVSHGEGRAVFEAEPVTDLVVMRYVDGRGEVTDRYPLNPNGSPDGTTALTTLDGRVTVMMPHPERVFRSVQLSWSPSTWSSHELSPWSRLFQNARRWVG
ncbi:MAG: phosphoribosylformylglycinamidine synthase, partial [Myxococcota bacterium]